MNRDSKNLTIKENASKLWGNFCHIKMKICQCQPALRLWLRFGYHQFFAINIDKLSSDNKRLVNP